ncbi:unnamed protein product [marine sediment metagenome]|uniref:Uncharacterized protein n=1 Tax=marine sediment metagenome TaxID=412755 RepID=X1HGU6_9ZZZZ
MKVAAVIVVYRGCLESVQVFLDTGKARKRYEKVLEEKGTSEADMSYSDYDITLETDLLVY